MKKTAIAAAEYARAAAPAWQRALALLDGDLRRRGAAERTRRAYGVGLRPVRALGDRRRARARAVDAARCAATPPA